GSRAGATPGGSDCACCRWSPTTPEAAARPRGDPLRRLPDRPRGARTPLPRTRRELNAPVPPPAARRHQSDLFRSPEEGDYMSHHRVLLAAAGLVTARLLAAAQEADPIRAKLDTAKKAYEADLEGQRKGLLDALAKREELARR